MITVRERRAKMVERWQALAEIRIRSAIESGLARSTLNPANAALALWAIIDGLLRAWMLAPRSFCLTQVGEETIVTYLDASRNHGR